MANDQQAVLLRLYPGVHMLPFDVADLGQVEEKVQADATGDTLFTFLWRELANAESSEAAALLMAQALRDVSEVYGAFEVNDRAETAHQTLLRSYPGTDVLPLDLNDHESVAQAVAEDRTGDTLFGFLWRELADAETHHACLDLLAKAADDLLAVSDGFAFGAVTIEPVRSSGLTDTRRF